MFLSSISFLTKKTRCFVCNLEQGGNLKVVKGSNEAVSHLIIAGSDIMLCINFFQDPLLQVPVCFPKTPIIALIRLESDKIYSLMVQLKALKYGTAPIELNPQTM